MKRLLIAALALSPLLLAAGPVQAQPKANVSLTIGAATTDWRTVGPSLAFHLGGRGSLLFGRNRGSDHGFGPYLDVATAAFDSIETGGGVEWLIPVIDELPIVLSGGAFARHTGPFGWEPGLASTVFFGSRSHNFHSWYGLAAGLFVQGRYGLGDGKQADLIFGAQIDLLALAFPAIFLYQVIKH